MFIGSIMCLYTGASVLELAQSGKCYHTGKQTAVMRAKTIAQGARGNHNKIMGRITVTFLRTTYLAENSDLFALRPVQQVRTYVQGMGAASRLRSINSTYEVNQKSRA